MKPFLFLFWTLLPVVASGQIGSKIKSSGDTKIEGTWHNNQFGFEMVLMLNPGGSGEFDGEEIQYKVSGNILVITSQDGTNNYDYALEKDKLTLSGGDLDNPVIFTRMGTQNEANNSSAQLTGSQPGSAGNSSLIGQWESATESLEFRNDGTVMVQGTAMAYKVIGSNLTIQSPNGTQSFTYSVQPGYLTINLNGQSQVYKKAGVSSTQAYQPGPQNQGFSQQPNSQNSQGVIAPELVGKWCYVNVSSGSSSSWSTDECITINSDGTYEYYYESSGSVSGYNQYGDQTFAGGTGSQNSDRGTWRLAGNTLYVQSQAKGSQTLTLQKINNPKNGDPMIVIDGRAYVTYYQKPSW